MADRAASQPSATTGPVAVQAPGFVGRQRELESLTSALAAPGALILIEGEPGIGKTRLLREFLAGAGAGAAALVAACPPFREPQTLGPVADALRQVVDDAGSLSLGPVAGALRPLFPEWAADLPGAHEPAEDASAARHRVFRALAELLGHLRIGMLALDDAHWADDVTLEFLLYLRTSQPRRISLVVSYRPEEIAADSLVRRLASRPAADGGQVRLTLRPLDVAGTAGLMSSMLAGQHVSGEFAGFVHEHTEGVPLAVEESVRLMGERDDLIREAGRWVRRDLAAIEVPPCIRDSVLERVGRLDQAAVAVLRAAAVLGELASEALVAAVCELPAEATRDGLSLALACGLLAENARGMVAFRHVLAQRAVYEAIPAPRRRALHRRAGEALQASSAPVARLSRHYREGGDTARWSEYGRQAAELALTAGDEVTAASLISDLIGTAPGADLFRLLDTVNFASLTSPNGYLRDLIDVLRGALANAGMSQGDEAQARFQLARLLRLTNDNTGCYAELERAMPNLDGDPERAAWGMAILGWLDISTLPASTQHRWLRRAAALTRSLDAPARIGLRCDLITGLLMLGDAIGWEEAARLPDDSPSAVERRSLTIAKHNVSEMAVRWGRYQQARPLLAAAHRFADAHKYPRYREAITMNQARLDWFTGNWPAVPPRVRQARPDGGSGASHLDAVLIASLLDGVAGARAKAADGLRYVLAERRRRGDMAEMMEPAAALAKLALADDDADKALEVTDEPAATLAAKAVWLWGIELVPARVAALAAAGRAGEADEVVAAFGGWLRGSDIPAGHAALILSRAILAEARGELAVAGGLFGAAAAAWRELPRPYDALLAAEARARCLLATGGDQAGIAELQRAAGGLSALGADSDARRVGQTLRARGVQVKRQRAGRPGYGGALSPRELDVARLLVAGGSNKIIAKQLFLSPKTVGRHVESAMRKLGVPSRTALAVRLVDQGLIPGTCD